MRTIHALLVLVALGLPACAADVTTPGVDLDGDGRADDGTGIGPDYTFAFNESAPEAYSVKIDHLGFSLITTVALHRSDAANCRGVTNQAGLLDLYRGLQEIQNQWSDELAALGYPSCVMRGDGEPSESNIVDFLSRTPCTTQRVYRELPSGERIGGMRVLDLITPDFNTIDVDEPGGFPNGRRPDDQITDLVLAMGLVDLSELDVSDVHLNPPANDVPFPDSFPHLAPAHRDVPPRLYR